MGEESGKAKMNTESLDSLAKSRTVLLVDDEKMVLQVGSAILQRLGHDVIVAGSGEEALEKFHQFKSSIGCVVLDLTMPGMDGQAVFDSLRKESPALPVIIATGLSEGQVFDQFGDSPPTAVIQKPYQVMDLSGKIESVFTDL